LLNIIFSWSMIFFDPVHRNYVLQRMRNLLITVSSLVIQPFTLAIEMAYISLLAGSTSGSWDGIFSYSEFLG
jgi:hypothetical protein